MRTFILGLAATCAMGTAASASAQAAGPGQLLVAGKACAIN